MLIFVEGVDKSGKSTMIRQLSDFTSLPIYRKEPSESITLADHHTYFKGVGFALVELHNLFRFDVIVDRSFISDWVYTNKIGPVKDFSVWSEWELRQQFLDESFIIYVSVSEEIFIKRITASPDPYMDIHDFSRYTNLYEQYLQKTTLPSIRVRGDVPFSDQLKVLQGLIKKCKIPPLKEKLVKYFSPAKNC